LTNQVKEIFISFVLIGQTLQSIQSVFSTAANATIFDWLIASEFSLRISMQIRPNKPNITFVVRQIFQAH